MTLWTDPIVDDVHRIRRDLAAPFNHDLFAMCEELRSRQRTSGLTYLHRDEQGCEHWKRLGEVVDGPLPSEQSGGQAPDRGFDTTPWIDPIVDEVHRIRAEIAAERNSLDPVP